MNEGKRRLQLLSDALYDHVWDYDRLSQEEIRERLWAIDRCRYWHDVYKRNAKSINRMEHELKSRLIEHEQFPPIHPDWRPVRGKRDPRGT